jgi:hypothetical protein
LTGESEISGLEEAGRGGGVAGDIGFLEAELEAAEAGAEDGQEGRAGGGDFFEGLGAEDEGAPVLGAVEDDLVEGVGRIQEEDRLGESLGADGGRGGGFEDEGQERQDGDAEEESGEEAPDGAGALAPLEGEIEGGGARFPAHGVAAAGGRVVA